MQPKEPPERLLATERNFKNLPREFRLVLADRVPQAE